MRNIVGRLHRHRWALFAVTIGCAGVLVLLTAWPGIQRRFAAEMLVLAIETVERDLEGSTLLLSAIERVKRVQARDEAIAKLIPRLNVNNDRERARAQFCLHEMDGGSPSAISALVEIYRDPLTPWWNRIEVAGLLTSLAPQVADENGASAVVKLYFGRRTHLMSAEDRKRLAEALLDGDDTDRRIDDADTEEP